jgi:succinate dehydrogenase flavin-adding protein (antitoxin of CptAB toxin-antitoxin module)
MSETVRPFDEIELKRMRWRSRRGLLELDIIIERFLNSDFDTLSYEELAAYRELLTWEDNDLLDLVNAKVEADVPHLQPIIDRLRRA